MIMNNIFGIHTASIAGQPALVAKVADIVWKRIYEKLSASPIPNDSPIPPLRFCAEMEAPISVSMNAAKGVAKRL